MPVRMTVRFARRVCRQKVGTTREPTHSESKYNGKWSAGSTTQEIKAIAEKNRQTNKTTCRYLKDELVNGEMAAVYSVHEVSPKSMSDSKTWISKAKGLPLRSDMDMEGGKSHFSTRYEYGNVKPPM
jgi:hypothetical protein